MILKDALTKNYRNFICYIFIEKMQRDRETKK